MRHVCRNLSSSALIRITHCLDRNGPNLDLVVEDTGIGMTEKALSDVFNTPGRQGSGTRGARGTGFGLPLCKQLMESIGGELTLENCAGGGLRATIRFSKATDAH